MVNAGASLSQNPPFLSPIHPFCPSIVETKLCDPDVNSQAGYFKNSGSKDKNCTCTEKKGEGKGKEGKKGAE